MPNDRNVTRQWLRRRDGCDYAPRCVECPLVRCRLEFFNLKAAVTMTRLAELYDQALTDKEIASIMQMDIRHLQKLIKKGKARGYITDPPTGLRRVQPVEPLPVPVVPKWVDFMGLRLREDDAARISETERAVRALYRISWQGIRARSRQRHLVPGRHAMMLALHQAGLRLTDIAFLVKRDHSSVWYGVQAAAERAA